MTEVGLLMLGVAEEVERDGVWQLRSVVSSVAVDSVGTCNERT